MKYLGVDYGTKKIGLAMSDGLGMIAFPYRIIAHTPNTISEIVHIIKQENVGGVVVGESRNIDGQENIVQQKINIFIAELGKKISLPIILEQEWMSSVSARAGMYSKGNIANPKWTGKQNKKKSSAIDDSAAAIILQRYLDKQ